MASFDGAIPPGGVGKITLSVSTKGYQGSISKRARVYSNDPKNKQATLTLMASVKEPNKVEVSPNDISITLPDQKEAPPFSEQISGQGASGHNIPPGAEQLGAGANVIPPLGEEPVAPVMDPNVTPPPGAEPIAPVVDPNVIPPPGAEPLKPTPSLEPNAQNVVPSDTEEENASEQPKKSSGPKATQSGPPGT